MGSQQDDRSGYKTALDHVFAEMERLETVDMDHLADEVTRARAVASMANCVVGVSREIREASRMKMELAGSKAFDANSKGLLEGPER